MNANELKQIDFCNPDSTHYANSEHYIAQLEAMISQQQAEIEALKAENKEYEKHIAIGVLMRLRKAQEK